MDIVGISLTETDGQIFLRGQPNAARAPVDAAMLHTLLAQFGAGNCALDEAAIATAVEHCNARPDPFVLQIAERRNASIDVQIAADEMSAVVDVTPAQGGKVASVGDLIQALTEVGVVFGIDDSVLLRVSESGAASQVTMAYGTLPEDGLDSGFEELLAQTVDRAPKLDANGLIDYREHGDINVVHAGLPLMRRIPATEGVNGRTVKGRILAARPGRDEPFAPQLPGTQISSDDPNLLQAAVTGQPVRVKCGVTVEPVLQMPEVNMATGNIHFDGSVRVTGDVVQGMKVQASGDIVVDGMVDSGVLEAGGNITIAGGVIAHAKLRAGGSVSARFAQGVQIHAGTVIALADMALECELQSLNQIIIGAESQGRGRLIGGTVNAMMRVSTPILGSAKGAVTKVTLGSNPELVEKYAALQLRIEKEKEAEENLEKLVKQITAAGDPKGMLPRIRESRQHAIHVWGQSLAERKDLEAQIAIALSALLEVTVGVAGAVDLVFGSHIARLRREFNTGTFSLDSGGVIVFTNALGVPVPAA